jgi:leucyl aminopeptidase
MNISFADHSLPRAGVLLLTAPKGTTFKGRLAEIDKKTGGTLKKAAKAVNFDGKKGSFVELLAPKGVSAARLVILGLGDPAELTPTEAENLGGKIAGRFAEGTDKELAIWLDETKGLTLEMDELAARLAFGMKLRAYRFDKYKTKKKDENGKVKLAKAVIMSDATAKARRTFSDLAKLADGIFFARDLVNEPANILHPEEFAARVKEMSELGLKIEVLGEKQMEKLGMGALLGVGQGSRRESQLVVMRWEGGKKGEQPIAFIGKGVCFDTGGISIKPAASMEDMKGDMGGAACVAGLMRALAGRKAKVNAIGVIGLVENMPDGNAQRPGDIVTSMSGQTIEVINTDAEGRLVLCDALWYTQDRFKPKFMIDLATLTGAIMISLGQEYAGLFSNDDELSDQLFNVGEREGEKVWRMPMGPAYDKMIDSKFADMKNVGGRFGGSITAAQFLQRFVNDVPWVHLDIAGTAMSSPASDINTSWGSGYGVRLLDRLVASHYEG